MPRDPTIADLAPGMADSGKRLCQRPVELTLPCHQLIPIVINLDTGTWHGLRSAIIFSRWREKTAREPRQLRAKARKQNGNRHSWPGPSSGSPLARRTVFSRQREKLK